MRRLLVMRHAKSSWKNVSLSDHDRPLNDRGKRDAVRAGEYIVEQDATPDAVLCSSAKRAKKTAERVVEALGEPREIVVVGELYHANPATYAQWVASVPAEIETLLVIGHNPGMAYWVEMMTGIPQSFPTSTIACVKLDAPDWPSVQHGTGGELEWLWYPKLES